MTCVRPINFAAWARLAGPVVQFSNTGSLPARCRPRNARSHATDDGSSRPTFRAASAALRFREGPLELVGDDLIHRGDGLRLEATQIDFAAGARRRELELARAEEVIRDILRLLRAGGVVPRLQPRIELLALQLRQLRALD